MLNIAIVEDNKADAARLTAYLDRFSSETGRKINVAAFDNAVVFLEKYAPRYDIIFMDIDMPMLSGMDASRRLREIDKNVILIFVTNLAQFAVDGYEVHAYDFVVKPIGYYSFSIKLKRAIERLGAETGMMLDIRTREKLTRVASKEVKYIEIYDHNLIYHTESGDITAVGTLSEIESSLRKVGFYRCSRCYLVNLRYVLGVHGNAVNMGGLEIQISSGRRKGFMAALADHLSGKVNG